MLLLGGENRTDVEFCPCLRATATTEVVIGLGLEGFEHVAESDIWLADSKYEATVAYFL